MSNLLSQASLVMIPSGYKEDVVYSQIPTSGAGDLSFTRASNGTRINSAGLVEDCPWNLMTYSEDLTNTSQWNPQTSGTGTASVTGNYAVAPNGTTTADRVQVNGGTGYAMIAADEPVVNGQVYTYSVWLKSLSGTPKIAVIYDGSIVQTATLTSDWVRYTFTFTGTGGNTYPRFGVWQANWGTSLSADFLVWGAQLNIGSTAKPYFPTTDRLNVPRLTYQNGGGGCPSLLLEPQRTNLVLYSEQFDNASWTKLASSVTSNTTTSPDGNTNADTVTSDGTNALHAIQTNSVSFNILTNYSLTVFAKKGTNNFVQLVASVAIGGMFANFDLNNGVVGTLGSVTGATPTSSIESVGDGWYRCTMNFTANAISGSVSSICIVNSSSAVRAQQNTLATSVILWGAQIEQGAYATTYIPTTTASATRVADSFSRNNIFTNGLITSSGGTWFVELRGNEDLIRSASAGGVFINTGTVSLDGNGFLLRNTTSASQKISIAKYISGTPTTLFNSTTSTLKVAIKWNGSTADIFVNGTKEVSATTFTTTAMENLISEGTNRTLLISQMDLFPTPLTDAECIALTTL